MYLDIRNPHTVVIEAHEIAKFEGQEERIFNFISNIWGREVVDEALRVVRDLFLLFLSAFYELLVEHVGVEDLRAAGLLRLGQKGEVLGLHLERFCGSR